MIWSAVSQLTRSLSRWLMEDEQLTHLALKGWAFHPTHGALNASVGMWKLVQLLLSLKLWDLRQHSGEMSFLSLFVNFQFPSCFSCPRRLFVPNLYPILQSDSSFNNSSMSNFIKINSHSAVTIVLIHFQGMTA